MKLQITPPLDAGFSPLSVLLRDYEAASRADDIDVAVCVEREKGRRAARRMRIRREQDEATLALCERIVKTLLWAAGGWKITVGGSEALFERIQNAYAVGGARDFDRGFMARVYERPFEVAYVPNASDVPDTHAQASPVGRHLDGCRIGFDAGGSDRKVSAVVDGEPVYSEEVIWHPKTQSDPAYHFEGVLDSFKNAAAHMPRVDAIGISSAGVYVDNRVMVASLFLKVPEEEFEKKVKNLYIDACRALGPDIPFEVANDGDVTALAGAMELGEGRVLGIAMGTSEAGGYVDAGGNITGMLNELAFAPVDAQAGAPEDEWSGDIGCGVKYFSQDGVVRLAPLAGIELPEGATLAEKLKFVQNLAASGDPRTDKIYDTIGVWFGYALAWYAAFYDIKHVLIMGRVTSGTGGARLLEKAGETLRAEFPELADQIKLSIPDEKSRRVGQSVAAASLPERA